MLVGMGLEKLFALAMHLRATAEEDR